MRGTDSAKGSMPFGSIAERSAVNVGASKFNFSLRKMSLDDNQEKESNKPPSSQDFEYKEVSELSEATDQLQAESVDGQDELNDLDDYEILL